MSVLPLASPCTPCAETVLRPKLPHLPGHDDAHSRVFEMAKQGQNTTRLEDQGMRKDVNVFSSRTTSEECLAGPSARIEHDG